MNCSNCGELVLDPESRGICESCADSFIEKCLSEITTEEERWELDAIITAEMISRNMMDEI